MNSIEKLNFQALEIDRINLPWSSDVEAHLSAKNLQDKIITDTGISLQEKAKALVLIRHHLAEA
jgi:hypothetical protein